MKRMSRFAWLIVFVLLLHSTGLADQIVMKNGDRLTGVIVKGDDSSVIIESEYAGVLKVKADAIAEITSAQRLHLTLKDGKTVGGRLVIRDARVEVEPESGAKVSFERSAVGVIRSKAEQDAYNRSLTPGWLEFWNGFVDLGYSLTTGNINTSTVTLGTNLARETRRDKTTLYAALIKSKNEVNDVSQTTANAIRGGARYEYNLTKRLFAFGFGDFEYNEIQLLDLRMVLGGGMGYNVIKNERTDFSVFGGGSYNYEAFANDTTRNSAEIIVGQAWSHRISDRLTLRERFQLFPNLSDTGEYRLTFDAGLAAKIWNRLDWQITVSDRYLSNPLPGTQGNDLLLTTGLRFNLAR